MTLSSVPYCASHFAAVFGPTFATPGTLSTASPVSVRRSSIWSGRTSNFASTPASSNVSLLIVLTILMRGRTSCVRSLSDDEMTVSMPASAACCASVPMTSSASTPSTISSGQPCARTQLVQRLDLPRQVVRHRRAVRLVLRIPVVAERLARRVEHDGEVVRLAVLDHSAQHRQHSAQRAGRLARATCADRGARGTRGTGTTTRPPARA